MYYIVSVFIVPPGDLTFNDLFVVASLVCHFRLVYVVCIDNSIVHITETSL